MYVAVIRCLVVSNLCMFHVYLSAGYEWGEGKSWIISHCVCGWICMYTWTCIQTPLIRTLHIWGGGAHPLTRNTCIELLLHSPSNNLWRVVLEADSLD